MTEQQPRLSNRVVLICHEHGTITTPIAISQTPKCVTNDQPLQQQLVERRHSEAIPMEWCRCHGYTTFGNPPLVHASTCPAPFVAADRAACAALTKSNNSRPVCPTPQDYDERIEPCECEDEHAGQVEVWRVVSQAQEPTARDRECRAIIKWLRDQHQKLLTGEGATDLEFDPAEGELVALAIEKRMHRG